MNEWGEKTSCRRIEIFKQLQIRVSGKERKTGTQGQSDSHTQCRASGMFIRINRLFSLRNFKITTNYWKTFYLKLACFLSSKFFIIAYNYYLFLNAQNTKDRETMILHTNLEGEPTYLIYHNRNPAPPTQQFSLKTNFII